MSYNLWAEGTLDYEAMARLAARFPDLELFPAPARTRDERDAVGIALPTSHAHKAGVRALLELIRALWAVKLAVFDLYQGTPLATEDDLRILATRFT